MAPGVRFSIVIALLVIVTISVVWIALRILGTKEVQKVSPKTQPSSNSVQPPEFVSEKKPDNSIPAPAQESAPISNPIQPVPDEILERVIFFRNADLPLDSRMAELKKLPKSEDPRSAEILMAVAGDKQYLNRYAVEALGEMKNNRDAGKIVKFLESKLTDVDAQMASASVKSLGKLGGTNAVPALVKSLASNASRPDGFSTLVCLATVQTLGLIGSPSSVPYLVHELSRPGIGPWNLDYGSEILVALRTINDPSAKSGVDAYISRLKQTTPNDPLAGRYYEEKIVEAQNVSSSWRKE
jgi:hypothetical protein